MGICEKMGVASLSLLISIMHTVGQQLAAGPGSTADTTTISALSGRPTAPMSADRGSDGSTRATHDPVIFVHGFAGSPSNWDDMIGDFEFAGWPADRLVAVSYNWLQSNLTTAAQINDVVNSVRARTGARKVDIVAHSMGGLPSRWYLKFLGGAAYIDHWVSIGGPNHGTLVAGLCSVAITSCAEMTPRSTLLRELNAGDETPGAVRYATLRSSCDKIVHPNASVVLSGATNIDIGCVGHYMVLRDDVSEQIRKFILGQAWQ